MGNSKTTNRGMSMSMAGFIRAAFFAIIVTLSSITSFLFFVEVFQFGRGFLADPFWSAIITGAVGVIVLDGAAIAWLKIYLGASDNNDLRGLAAIGAAVGVAGSAVASFSYLVMVAAEGFQAGDSLRLYVQVGMAAVIVIHFILVFLSGYYSTSAKVDEQMAGMLSEATDEMLTLTGTYFREAIPALAMANAQVLTRELAGRFASLTVHDNQHQPAAAAPQVEPPQAANAAPVPAPAVYSSNGAAHRPNV